MSVIWALVVPLRQAIPIHHKLFNAKPTQPLRCPVRASSSIETDGG
jgi:hypothetical protein